MKRIKHLMAMVLDWLFPVGRYTYSPCECNADVLAWHLSMQQQRMNSLDARIRALETSQRTVHDISQPSVN